MAIRKVYTYPDEILRKQCEFIKEVRKQERNLFDDMVDTMVQSAGVGLAALQVGEQCQIFVAGFQGRIYKVANPVIAEFFGTEVMEEGCLSVPEKTVEVERFYGLVLEGLDEKGEKIRIKAEGMLARIFQHEIDHLNGKLIIDYSGLSTLGGR
jgi:peptide deformylase